MQIFRLNRLVFTLLCTFFLIFVTSIVSPTYAAKNIKIRIAGQYAKDHPATKALYEFKEKIESTTNKRIKVKIYPANQLGDYTQVYEELRRGTIHMGQITVPSQFDTRLEVTYLHYLAMNYDEARKIYSEGSVLYETMSRLNSGLGVKFLGFNAEGFGGLGMNKEPDNMLDPAKPKNILMRLPPMAVFIITVDDEGFQTVSVPFAELYTALQTGVADGWSGTPPMTAYLQFREVCKYYMVNNNFFETDSYLMSQKFWDKLSKDDQQLIQKTISDLSKKSFDISEENDMAYLDKFEKAGVKVIRFTNEQLKAWADHARKTTWLQLYDRLTKEMIDKLMTQY